MSLPWEPPPFINRSEHCYRYDNNNKNSNRNTTDTTSFNNNNKHTTANDRATNNTLGDFDVLLSFLHLERTSLSTPSTVATATAGAARQTTSAATAVASSGDLSSMVAPSWDDSSTPSPSTPTSQLGDFSMVMRYLQAHKTLPLGARPDRHTLDDTSSPTPQPTPIPSQDLNQEAKDNGDDDDDNESLTTNRRRLKKKSARKLPIDEPSSSSCGGWLSSESDHKEIMGPEPDLAYEISNPSNASAKEQQQQQEQQQPLKQSTDNLSSRTPLKPNHISLRPLPTVATTTWTVAAVTTATSVVKRKRPWRAAKVLKEMKALFVTEQRKHHQPTLDAYRTREQPTTTATTTTISIEPDAATTPITTATTPRAQLEEGQELVLNQTPGYESELLWRPRTHYNNFWRSCTATSSDHYRSSSSEEESLPTRLGGEGATTAMSASAAVAFGSTTSTSPCLSETKGCANAKARQLLAMRVRDTFLAPKGTLLLDQALSRAVIHLPDSSLSSSSPTKETPKGFSTAISAQLELGTMKALTRTTTPLSASSMLTEIPRPDPTMTPATITAQYPYIEPTPPSPPKTASSSERVFIFVDNSNILHGFYQVHQRQPLEAQRADGGLLSFDKCPAPLSETAEDGMGLVTPAITTTTNDDGLKSFPVGTCFKTDNNHNNKGSYGGPKAKMARGSHLLPKFNYSKFFELLKRNRTTARQVLVGSSPLFQELDEAMEHQYETIILRRVKKFVQGELGVVPVPVKQLRYPSNNYDTTEPSVVDKSSLPFTFANTSPSTTITTTPTTTATTTTTTTTTTTSTTMAFATTTTTPLAGGARGEQAVDELLHLKMLETLLDHEPATMVLATGDGGDSEFGGGGFYAVIKRALDRGWHVEVVSWEDQLSGVYLELALEYGYNCDHKLVTTGCSSGKQCHAPLPPSELEPSASTSAGKQKQKQQKNRLLGTKKQRAQAQAQQEKERTESRQRGSGHLRVWCLDWYGDILLQPTPNPH